ncbi:hypothetical protein JW711_04215 [Candidatus Woesearchaeota archaeon]|nr:hypothetical protein [Candidatus Woesearchaeota archaeon]
MDKKGKIAIFASLFLVAILAAAFVLAGPSKACRDGVDNDGDGLVDYPADPGCSSKNDASELGSNECDDGVDNDGDGNVDTADSGCASAYGTDETDCGDGVCEGGETSGTCPADCGQPDSCADTDGFDTSVLGTASGYYGNSPYSDDDYCADAANVVEYYCSGDYEQSLQVSCGTDSYGADYCSGDDVYKDLTDYFCASGACDSTVVPELVEDCDASDGYGADYCSGDDVYRDYADYFCTGGVCDFDTTPEFVEACDGDGYGANYCMNGSVFRDFTDYFCASGACDSDVTPEFVEYCPYGCTAGECNGIPDSCFETDGGFNPVMQGNITGYLDESFYVETDFCLDNVTLREYYCVGDYAYSYDLPCFNGTGCLNGVCY